MAEQTFLTQGTEDWEEVAAIASSAGAGSEGKIPCLDAAGKLHLSFMPAGVAAEVIVAASSENLSAGDLVNLWNDSGTLKARKADASNGRRAHGYVAASVTSPANADVYTDGVIAGLSSLTPGASRFLGTAGANVSSAATTSGHSAQKVGFAKSATELVFEAGAVVVRA